MGAAFRPSLSRAASDKIRYFTEKYPDLAPDGTHVCNFLINSCADWLDWTYAQMSMGRPVATGISELLKQAEHVPTTTSSVKTHKADQQDDFLAELGDTSMD